MRIHDYITSSAKGLSAKKMRTVLTFLSILIGVCSITLISTIGNSGKATINHEMDKLGLNGISVKSTKKTLDEKQLLNQKDAMALKEYLGEEFCVSASLNNYGEMEGLDEEVMVCGSEKDMFSIMNLKLVSGRGITRKDVENEAQIAVIDEKLARKLYGTEEALGRTLHLNGSEELTVVGILMNDDEITDKLQIQVPSFVYIPVTTAQRMFHTTAVTSISISASEDKNLDNYVPGIIQFLEKEKNQTFKAENLNQQKKQINHIADIVTLIIAIIGGISLVVGGLGVMNTMLVSVSERKKEIGIKKAIGATNGNILAEFILEAIFLTVLSGIAGILSGIAIGKCLTEFYGLIFVLNTEIIWVSFAVSVVIGVLFGGYPAWKAARLKPMDALRS